MPSNSSTLGPISSGAKVLTGTKAVITGQARNLINNTKRIANNAKQHLEYQFEVAPDTEVELKHDELFPSLSFNRKKIKTRAMKILKESMYESPYNMGDGATMVRNVVNPYNPKRKSESIVDQRARFKSKNDIYPKVKVDNSIMDDRVRKVRAYVYKVNGVPVATKLEHQPKQPVIPV